MAASKPAGASSHFLSRSALRAGAGMFLAGGAFLGGGASVHDAPDGVGAVVGYQQRAVGGYGDADRPAPHVSVVDGKAGDEVFVLATGAIGLVQRYADHFVSGADGAISGAMFGGENVSAIFGWELRGFVKGHLKRREVRLQEYVGDQNFVFQLGMFALRARILMAADVPPGPAVEAAFLDVRDVVGDEVVA